MTHDAPPPQCSLAELDVIGACLRRPEAIDEAAQVLSSDHFYSDAHQKIFAAILHLHSQTQSVTLTTLFDELVRRGHVEDVGGYPYLGKLLNHSPTGTHAGRHAGIVYDKSLLRRVIHASTETLREAYDQRGTAEEILEAAERRILDIGNANRKGDTVPLSVVAAEYGDYVDAREKQDGACGVPIEFPDLEHLIPGWERAEFIIVGARPSAGKTAFGCQVARYTALECGVPVFFASLEQSRVELYGRMACGLASVNSQLVRKGKLSREEKEALRNANDRLWNAPVFVNDRGDLTALQLAAHARRLKRKHKVGLVMVDYLQLIAAEDRRAQRQEQVATVALRLKCLAKGLDIPVIALSQVNRNAEGHQRGGKPRLCDLRESGAIEAHADTVILLYRPEPEPGASPDHVLIELDVAKQRNGPIGGLTLMFNRTCTRFENHAQEPPMSRWASSGGNGY